MEGKVLRGCQLWTSLSSVQAQNAPEIPSFQASFMASKQALRNWAAALMQNPPVSDDACSQRRLGGWAGVGAFVFCAMPKACHQRCHAESGQRDPTPECMGK